MLDGRVAIVTGAARGIGRGIAEALVDAGANVVLADIAGGGAGASSEAARPAAAARALTYELSSASQLESAAREVAARGRGRTLAVACDVTNAAQVAALVARAREAFGRIDLVVNNAGVVHFGPLEEIDEARWDLVYAVNEKGPYLVSRAALNELTKAQGSIVNIASVAGKRGRATGTLYCSYLATAPNVTGVALNVAGGMEVW